MEMGIRKYTFILLCLTICVISQAGILNVDDDGPAVFDNIQDAINNSNSGDIIIVQPGTYNEVISFNGQAITITSTNPDDPNIVQATIITSDSDYCVHFEFGEDANSVLTGFTILKAGIQCIASSPVITKNIIKESTERGVYGENNAAPLITDNTIELCERQGIYGCNGPISNNIITRNIGGIAVSNGPITNNEISYNYETNNNVGGAISKSNGLIEGNYIAHNFAPSKGGGCFDCWGDIRNNIIVGNESLTGGGALYNCNGNIYNNIINGNISNDGGALFGCFGYIFNNTFVGNYARNNGGALNQCDFVFNNIFAYNEAENVGGIYAIYENHSNVFWLNTNGHFGGYETTAGEGDFNANPLFVDNGYWETNGTPDGSDDYWVNGDYHLKSTKGRWDPNSLQWVTDDIDSPCIDKGDPNTALIAELWPHGNRVNVGAYGNTTQASMSSSNAGNIADINYDGWIDYNDMKILTEKWLLNEVLLLQDLNRDGLVNLIDYSILIANWLERPPVPQPPTPDPMTWATEPYAISTSAISMTATIATSTDESGVEYYFECVTSGGHDSGWQNEPNYTDTNLNDDTVYSYKVMARNKENLLETEFSPARSATTLAQDTTPPTPNPAEWATEPNVTSPGSKTIQMVAATASDPSGVEYYFQCKTNSQYSSNWQDSPSYEVGSLPDGIYTFVVKVRDKSTNQNTTDPSSEVTLDLQAPTPNPMQWAQGGKPVKVQRTSSSTTGYWAEMTAAEATDPSGGVEYFFLCTTVSGFSSGWQSSPSYSVQIGQGSQLQKFRVKARDKNLNETAYSSEETAL